MFSKTEIKEILTQGNDEILIKGLKIKKKIFGDEILLRGIIEFSNRCRRNCLYCGIRASNKFLKRYRISHEEIFEIIKNIHHYGIKTVVLQSGEDVKHDIKKLGKLIEKIKSNFEIAITLSLGDLKKEEYRYLKDSGADRYLLKFETSNGEIFEKLRPKTTLKDRLKNIYILKELGYEVGSGNIIGLPGTDLNTLVEDLILIKNLNLDMIGVGPFIPHKKTPLKNFSPPDIYLSLKFLSLVRIMNPLSHIPATTSFDALKKDGRLKALKAGANVIMMDITPPIYSSNYEIYNGKSVISYFKNIDEKLKTLEKMVKSGGGVLVKNIGKSLKK